MNPTLANVIDQAALVLWTAALQFGLFGIVLLVPIWIWRRSPAARHFLAMTALVAAMASPITAACSLRWGFDWITLPGWLRPEMPPLEVPTATAHPEQAPAPRPSPPRGDEPPPMPIVREHLFDEERPAVEAIDRPTPARAVELIPPAVERKREAVGVVPIATTPPVSTPTAGFTWPGLHLLLRGGLTAWFVGVLVMIVRGLRANRRLNRLICATRPVNEPRPLDLLQRVAVEQGLTAPPCLLASSILASPFVVGIRRPRVVVPESLLAPGDEIRLGHVLAHECAHVARRDLLIGRFQRLVEILGWPHPLVRIHATILGRAREDLCDNRVLLRVTPTDYAHTLLDIGERLSGLSPAPATAMFPRRHSLTTRIARLLDARRDPDVRLGPARRAALAMLAFATAMIAAGVGPSRPRSNPSPVEIARTEEPSRPAPEAPVPALPPTTDDAPGDLVRELASRAGDWVKPSATIETLEYDFSLGNDVKPIRVARGEQRRASVWMGATLHSGLHELLQSPDRFNLVAERKDGEKTIRLTATVKDENQPVRVEVGNGVEGSWRGYFSHPARATTIVVDAERHVPLEEQVGATLIRYADWREVGPNRWGPLRIDLINGSNHYRMFFDWLGEAAWLLHQSESVSPEATQVLSRTSNVKVNGRGVVAVESDAERRSRAAREELLTMLDHNRPWLDPGATGSGWQPSFATLSYTFHTVREDIRERCVLDRDGRAVFEVVGDGLGKMKDHLGDRKIALTTPESAWARRDEGFALIYGRSERSRGLPIDLALKQYARIGCQLDLPLFRRREQLSNVTVAVEDGAWNGQPCRVATISGDGRAAPLGAGTMLAFNSWSYVHDIWPSQEVIFIDPQRNVPIHETLTHAWDGRVFEIDYGDYAEAAPGQWAPLSIRIESKDYFTCNYRFQIVAGTRWMLAEVVSWFDPKDQSRGVIEDLRVDGDRTMLDDAMRQVGASRELFVARKDEPGQSPGVATIPFELGRPMRAGPYEVRVTLEDRWVVLITASTDDAGAPGTVPLGFLDEQGRLLFAPSITLANEGGRRSGSVTVPGNQMWGTVRSVVTPGVDTPQRQPSSGVIPIRWGEAMAINVPCAARVEPSSRKKQPEVPLTRAFRAQLDRAEGNRARLTLDVASIDGPQEFPLDLAVAILGPAGELLASGHSSISLRVESYPVENRSTFDLGPIRAGAEPHSLWIGLAQGDTTSSPIGSKWGIHMSQVPPFSVAALLAAPDAGCRRIGLNRLGSWETNESIYHEYLYDMILDDRRIGDGIVSRRTLLKPHIDVLVRILREEKAGDVKAAAARFLAYAESDGAAETLEPFVDDPDQRLRETVAVGLTFLGRDGYLDRLKAILGRENPSRPNMPQAEFEAWRSFQNLEQDALIALGHRKGDAEIDLLGEALQSDLEGFRLADDGKGGKRLEGRENRAGTIVRLLGRANNPRAVRWLILALDALGRRREVSEAFGSSQLIQALMSYPVEAGDRIREEIASGPAAAEWVYALSHAKAGPAFVPAVRAMLLRDEIPDSNKYYAVRYLWNVESPAADEVLRMAYDQGVVKDDPRSWLVLCEALAARGDGRGLGDAFQVLVDLERPAESPADEEARKTWKSEREKRLRQAEDVFNRASGEMVAGFLNGKHEAASPEERRVVLKLLWRLPRLPEPFVAIVAKWKDDGDSQVAQAARRLLDRD